MKNIEIQIMMNPSRTCCFGGWIAPNGDYYGSNDDDIQYIHIALSNRLMQDGLIPPQQNPDRWLEKNGWIKQHGNHICTLDRKDYDYCITQEQLNTLRDIIGQDYMWLEFVNQEKTVFINELLDLNEWELHYLLIN